MDCTFGLSMPCWFPIDRNSGALYGSSVRTIRTILVTLACLGVLGAAPAAGAPPPIRHVFVIVLENKGFSETFGANSQAPYLANTLTAQGQLIANYYGVAHLSLPNYIAMVSGQAPNPITQSDCQFYMDMVPGTIGADGQAFGQGCVYPSAVKTVADQLRAKGLTWRGYMEDMGNSATEPKTCRHPTLNSQDKTQSARVGDQYAARHNPFVYFHSIIDDTANCNANVVPLDRLPGDLASTQSTPNYSFITPNLCDDGHDSPCVDGRPGGLVSSDAFLRAWVPRILASPAFRQDGLLVVTFDEAETGDATACCDEQPGPNTPNPGGTTAGPGGGKIGAVALSPWVRPGSINAHPYNHYGFLRSVEDIFGLSHLGYAGRAGLDAFGQDVYNGDGPAIAGPACVESALPQPRRGVYRRGSLIATAKIVRSHGRARLQLVFRHRASLDARQTQRVRGRRRTVRIRLRSVRSCRTYRRTLSRGHGSVKVTARSGRGRETRTVRF
jgi:phosphatidylinositol-3-phosphatase